MVIPSVKNKCGPAEETPWKKCLTEHCVRVVRISTPWSDNPGFDSQPENRLSFPHSLQGGGGGGGVFLRVFQIIIRRRPTIPRYIKPHSWAGVVRIWLAHIQTFKYYGEILTQNTRKIYMLHISPSFCQAKLTYVKPVTKISVTTQ